jgi:PEGA domain
MNHRSVRPVLALLCALSAAPLGRASAQAPVASYDDTIRRAVVEFDAAHWEEARALFKRAHELNPSARTWRGMGITAFELRRYVDAVAELEAALADPRKPLTEQQRAEVQVLLQRAREFVSVYRIRVRPGSAEVRVDGQPASVRDGQVFLDPGHHILTVRAPGYAERRAELSVDAGEHEELSVELDVASEPLELEPSVPASSVPSEARQAPARRARPITWSLVGVTALALPTAVGLRIAAKNASDKVLDTDCAGDDAACIADVDALARRGQREEIAANVLFVASGALFTSAVLAYFLEGRAPARTSVAIGPRSVLFTHSF